MKRSNIPLNLEILDTNSQKVKNLRAVESLDIFDGATRQLHPDGLFSQRIFGRIGEEARDMIFAKIEFKLPQFDPNLFDAMVSLKGLYKEIIFGTKYAVFDELEKDFVQSNPIDGDTGFAFFMKHWKKIEFRRNNSDRRNVKIVQIEKYKERAEISCLVVYPAGLRDIEITEGGRPEEDEVNDLYREVMKAARVIDSGAGGDLRVMDNARARLQRAIQDVWQHFLTFVGGRKKSYLPGRFAGRRIFNSTRNVITAMEPAPKRLGDGNSPSVNDTQVGILQCAKGMLPVTIGAVRRYLLRNVFEQSPESVSAKLIHPDTFEQVEVQVSYKEKDYWTTKDGLTKMVESYRDDKLRDVPIVVAGHYLGLIYEGAEMGFKMFHDIRELPERFDRANVRPITLTDLIYLVCYPEWKTKYIFVTRYPVAGVGSIYPSRLSIISTTPYVARRELNDEWDFDSDSMVIPSYPIRGYGIYYDTMSVHPSRLVGLQADHDGDMSSGNFVYAEESVKELTDLLNKASFYLDPAGGLKASMSFYTSELVAHNMTGD